MPNGVLRLREGSGLFYGSRALNAYTCDLVVCWRTWMPRCAAVFGDGMCDCRMFYKVFDARWSSILRSDAVKVRMRFPVILT